MNQVLFHFKDTHLDEVIKLGFNYVINDNEVDVILPDVDYEPNDYYVDPDEQICNHYGINYDHLNCIELV